MKSLGSNLLEIHKRSSPAKETPSRYPIYEFALRYIFPRKET